LNGGSKVKNFVERYNSLFYYKNDHKRYKFGNKYIPSQILNASFEVREAFLEGFYAGDGAEHDIKSAKHLKFDIEGKIGEIIKPGEISFIKGKPGGVFIALKKDMIKRAEKLVKKG
jgi:hypothetical protein